MNDEEFLTFLRRLMVLNEDEVQWLLTGADEIDLIHARSALKATHDRVKRELMRRGWENLTEVPS